MSEKISRSRFLKNSAVLGAGALAAQGAGCRSGETGRGPNQEFLALPDQAGEEVVFGLHAEKDMNLVLEQAMGRLTDMKWLSPGDSVFIKVACNSGFAHPAVTDPAAIEAMVAFLKKKGAGKIYVGDQSGVQHVRLTSIGRKASTLEMMKQNGILAAIKRSGAILHNFDQQGWDGYYEEKADFKSHWSEGSVWLPKILRKVDHIINMPRLSAHILAGYTLGTKNAIGYLRDDSRFELHQKADFFFEKFAEINHMPVFRNKLRLTLTLVSKVLLNIGPDNGGVYDIKGVCVLGSRNMLNHDYVGSRLLPYFHEQNLSFFDLVKPYPRFSNFVNKMFVKSVWGADTEQGYVNLVPYELQPGLAFDVPLSHLATLQGRRPGRIAVKNVGDALPKKLTAHLKTAGPELVVI